MRQRAYMVFVDLHRLAYKYHFRKLDDSQWESLISDADRLFTHYQGTDVEYLFRGMFSALQEFYIRLSTEKG